MSDPVLASDRIRTEAPSRFDRTTALIIGIGSLAAIFAMAHHPSIAHASLADAVLELGRKRVSNEIVHGALIALMLAIFIAFVDAARSFGWQLGRIRVALVVHAFGVACMSGAALINGFAVARLASEYARKSGAELETLQPLLRLCFALNRVLAEAGTAAFSVAILAWSAALVARRGSARAVALLGLAVGIAPPLALIAGWIELDVGGMGLVVLAQSIWNACFAAWMFGAGAANRPR